MENVINDRCPVIQAGDLLGVYFDQVPWAVGYRLFQGVQPTTLQAEFDNFTHPFDLNDVIEFDRLNFPFDFLIRAYIDTRELNWPKYHNDVSRMCFSISKYFMYFQRCKTSPLTSLTELFSAQKM